MRAAVLLLLTAPGLADRSIYLFCMAFFGMYFLRSQEVSSHISPHPNPQIPSRRREQRFFL